MNNWPDNIYVRMYVIRGNIVQALAIINNNDILQTKYVVTLNPYITLPTISIGDSLHIVINDVIKHMGITYYDAWATDETTMYINNVFTSVAYGTWTSTIKPPNSRVELVCKVVKTNGNIVTTKCVCNGIWNESVFNRIPIQLTSDALFGFDDLTHQLLFGTNEFRREGSAPSGWNQYNVTRSGSSLIIGGQVTINGLPESFVSYWVDTIHVKAYMGMNDVMGPINGDGYAILVPPDA